MVLRLCLLVACLVPLLAPWSAPAAEGSDQGQSAPPFPQAAASLELGAGVTVWLEPSTRVVILAPLRIRLLQGRIWVEVLRHMASLAQQGLKRLFDPAGDPWLFSVETPAAVVGVRGTEFSVLVVDDDPVAGSAPGGRGTTLVSVASGTVELVSGHDSTLAVVLTEGEWGRVAPGRRPDNMGPMGEQEWNAWRRHWESIGRGVAGQGREAGDTPRGHGQGEDQPPGKGSEKGDASNGGGQGQGKGQGRASASGEGDGS